jgi:hypothetical protein
MGKSLKYFCAMTHQCQQEYPENVGRILQMKEGCARRRAITLPGPNDNELRALLLAFLELEPANLF